MVDSLIGCVLSCRSRYPGGILSAHLDGLPIALVTKDLGAHCLAEKDFVGLAPYLAGMGQGLQMRLRYFIAVAEDRSLMVAAERRLNTDLEDEGRRTTDVNFVVRCGISSHHCAVILGISCSERPMTTKAVRPATPRQPWYSILYIQVLIAIALGILIGYYYPNFGKALKPLGDGFIALIVVIDPFTRLPPPACATAFAGAIKESTFIWHAGPCGANFTLQFHARIGFAHYHLRHQELRHHEEGSRLARWPRRGLRLS